MRKFLALFLAAILTFSFPLEAFAEVSKSDYIVSGTVEQRGISSSLCPNVDASSSVLKDDSGKLLFSRNADAEVKIASLTKIMTFLVAADNALMSDIVTVSENAANTDGSSANLVAGDTMTLENLLKGLMIPSGNDAACAVAENVGKNVGHTTDDTAGYNAFIQAMNDKAAALGCQHTKFTNPHGLDDGDFASDSHSSANDLMLMIEAAMQNETFRAIVGQGSGSMQLTRDGAQIDVPLTTTDILIGDYDGACGIKTGTTDLAGYCFAGACERDGDMIYSVVLNSSDDLSRFDSTRELFDWYFNGYIDYKLCNGENNVMAQVANTAWLDKTFPATLANPEETIRIFRYDGNISESMHINEVGGSIKAGDKVGTVDFIQDNRVIATRDLVAAEDSEGPGIFDMISISFARFMSLFNGAQTTATSLITNETPLVLSF